MFFYLVEIFNYLIFEVEAFLCVCTALYVPSYIFSYIQDSQGRTATLPIFPSAFSVFVCTVNFCYLIANILVLGFGLGLVLHFLFQRTCLGITWRRVLFWRRRASVP